MKLLNLGVGKSPIRDAWGVDLKPGKYVDEVVDLTKLPWQWEDESIDGIYMIHSLEHFSDSIGVLRECHRILKPGGFLYVQIPHSTSSYAMSDLGHKACYSIATLRALDGSSYMGIHWFETVFTRIFYMFQLHNHKHPYVPFLLNETKSYHPVWRFVGTPIAWVIQKLIDMNPLLFERFWHGYVGGSDECCWLGKKI